MKPFRQLLTLCCLGLFVVSFTACDTGPGEIKKPTKDEITPPDIKDGSTADIQ